MSIEKLKPACTIQVALAAFTPPPAVAISDEALDDVQIRARGLIVQLEHPTIGTAKSLANPVRFSSTPVSYRLPPPLLGEHTAEILQSLGFTAEDVNSMIAESST